MHDQVVYLEVAAARRAGPGSRERARNCTRCNNKKEGEPRGNQDSSQQRDGSPRGRWGQTGNGSNWPGWLEVRREI